MSNAPHFDIALRYARDTWDDHGIEELQRLGARRFLDDLDSGRWDFKAALPEFCISIMTGLFTFAQAERLDGTPLRGKPFELMPWHVFTTYNVCGFYLPGTQIRRFTEANLMLPRKSVKTTFGRGLNMSLAMYYRMSGVKTITVAGSLKQAMEGFNWIKYNFVQLGLVADNNPPGKLRMLDSSLGHRIEGEFWGGHIIVDTLAFKPDLFDSFNAQFVHLDELELYKNAIPYTRLRDSMKGFTNKLLLTTFTAGDDGVGFAAQHRNYMEGVLRGTVTGPAAERTFVLLAQCPDQIGGVPYTDPKVFTMPELHRAANPAYNITIRPEDMIAAAQQAAHNPMLRNEFFTRSLNRFVGSIKAWFDLEEFRRSDEHYRWTQEDAAKLIRAWYGGADLSKLHDLTAADIVGEIPQKVAAEWCRRWAKADGIDNPWVPPEDVLVILPHCWFPVTAAQEKADQDQIPLFGWQEDGWLDMPNTPSMDPTEPVKQFLAWKGRGFQIKRVGHDRKFARPYYTAMRKAGFRIKDQPQLYLQKSEGFRYIEHKAKIGCLYYFSAEPFEYCVSNVRATEKVDDAVQYEKLAEHARIDVFDAAVFATVRMLIDTERSSAGEGWFDDDKPDERRHPISH